MNRLKSNMAAKTAAVILILLSAASFAASLAGIIMMDSFGVYRMDEKEMLEARYADVCYNYSIVAMAGYKDDFNKEILEGTNFRYGIIKTDDIEKLDLTDLKNYDLAGNFDQRPDSRQLNVWDWDVSRGTVFEYGSNIWDSFYSIWDEDEEYEETEYLIDGYYYHKGSKSLYVKSGSKLFLADDYYRDELMGDDSRLAVHDISMVNSKQLKALGEISDGRISFMDEECVVVLEMRENAAEHYYVVSYVQQPLQGEMSFWKGDMFIQMELLVSWMYQMRYWAGAILVLSAAVFLASFVFLMSAAGHHKGRAGICPGFLDRLPLDVYFAGVCFVEMTAAELCVGCLMRIDGWEDGQLFFWIAAVCGAAAGVLAALGFCKSAAVNIKLGKWWRNTFIYAVLSRVFRFCGNIAKGLFRSMTLLWKAWLVLGAAAFAEFVPLAALDTYYDGELLFLWFLEKLILYPVIIFLLMQMDKLQKGAQRIANGQLNYQVDTRGMFWELKKHGEYLNAIGTGMNLAVNERLKSEHFKTELITNVSHDIKTPLTSIINYVDLLEKEQIDNPAAQEYLEVLHRQSARLKKLIEDLMEASKASTGNLSVTMEQCDAGVMLVQTVGEFEEKLMENQIQLRIKRPQESILVEADSRHLWRVFDNIMNNICKYAQPATRAYVNLEKEEEQAVIIFRNISKCELNISSEELMERFVRGDSSRNTEGSGLGISIAKSLTELMNGTFELAVDGDLFKVILTFPLYGMRPGKRRGAPAEDAGTGRGSLHNPAGGSEKSAGRNLRFRKEEMFGGVRRFARNVQKAAEETIAEKECGRPAEVLGTAEAEAETETEAADGETGGREGGGSPGSGGI